MNRVKKSLTHGLSALVGAVIVLIIIWLKPTWLSGLQSFEFQSRQARDFNEIINKHKSIEERLHSWFDQDFFKEEEDPFEEMRKMREQMNNELNEFDDIEIGKSFSNPFDLWFSKKFGGSAYDIGLREDKNFIYYDIRTGDLDPESVKTNIENGYIKITARQKEEEISEDDEFYSHYFLRTSFSRSFPIPENVDVDKMEMIIKKRKITLKFPKIDPEKLSDAREAL